MDAASGTISLVRDLLRTQLATTHAVRTWDGMSLSVDQAKERIYQTMPLVEDLAALDDLRPFAVITKPERGVQWKPLAAPRHYGASGLLLVEFHWSLGGLNPDDPGALEREFENFIGSVVQTGNANQPGLLDLAQDSGYLTILEVLEDGPHRTDAEDQSIVGDCWLYFLHVWWGVA